MFLLGKNWQQDLRRKISRGPEWRELAEAVLSRAVENRETELPIEWEEGREVLLPTARNLAARSQSFVIAHGLTGDLSFLRSMLSDGLKAASLEDWNPEHFLDTAEMAFAVACIRHWVAPVATRDQIQTLEEVLHEIAVQRGLWSLTGGSAWTREPGNWNIVCNASLMVVAQALSASYPDKCSDLLTKAEASSKVGLNALGPGGEWEEGVVYLDHSAQFAWYAQQATGSRHFQPFFDSNTFRTAMTGPSGLIADFGDDLPDCPPPAIGPTGTTPAGTSPLHLLWGAKPEQTSDRFMGRTVACLRSPRSFLAVKLGVNRHLHAHADLGSFVWEANGDRLVCDPGRLRYDLPGYFDPSSRFKISGVMETAHNCVSFPDTPQEPTTWTRADLDGNTLVVSIMFDKTKTLERRFVSESDGSLTIHDRLINSEGDDGQAFWNCHFRGKPLGDNVWKGPGGQCFKAIFPVPDSERVLVGEPGDKALSQRCSLEPISRIRFALTLGQLRKGIQTQLKTI